MITDYGDITDQSFNQTTYEACKAFSDDNSIEFSYFKPAGDNTADRVAMIEKAVDEGFNVIVMPGYAFGGAIVEAAPEFPDVKFIALDVAAGDLLETAVAKAGIRLERTQTLEAEAKLVQDLPCRLQKAHVEQVVAQARADQKFHRHVIDLFALFCTRLFDKRTAVILQKFTHSDAYSAVDLLFRRHFE